MKIAIASDAQIYIAREEARASADGVALAESVFTPRVFGEIAAARDDRPPSATSYPSIDSTLGGSVGIAGRIGTGLTYTLAGGLEKRRHSDPIATLFDPTVTTTLRAELVQPLWRGAFGAARKPIVVATRRKEQSEHQLRAQVERAVGDVEVAYWDLVRVRLERDARTAAIALAKEQVDESKRLLKLGSGSDLDVVEADAGVSRREQELLRSEQDVIEAESRLTAAIGVRTGDPGWSATQRIVPSDVPRVETTAPDFDAQLAIAREKRAEVLAARELLDAERTALEVTDDRRRAAIDLVVAGGTVGFAGSLASTPATTGVMFDSAYTGGLSASTRNALGRDLHVYFGLRYEIPLGDDETEVRHSIQQRTTARARLAQRETLVQVESEVRTAVARVELASKSVAAADRTVKLAEKLLEGMRKRFRAGATTSFDVLRVSDELTRSRIEAARARADYEVSLTRLATATGTLLEGFGITVKSLGASPK